MRRAGRNDRFQVRTSTQSVPIWLVWWTFESVPSCWLQPKATPQSSRDTFSPFVGSAPRSPALSEWPAGPLRCPVTDGRLSVAVAVRQHKFEDSSVHPQRDTSLHYGYHGGPKLRHQRNSSPVLHSLLHGPSRKAILVRRTWRRGFDFRLSGSATRRRQRGEGNKGVALIAHVEPRCSTASVCARVEPSNRALEVSPWIVNHLR